MRKEYGSMGFRHVYGFNLSMLGKQGWRLLTNQYTIVSRVFKDIYFLKVDFFKVRVGHNPSSIWRSIHTSHVIMREGLR